MRLADHAHARRPDLLDRRGDGELGLAVAEIPADPDLPDCCFVEDPVVRVGELVVTATMAAAERRGESVAVLAAPAWAQDEERPERSRGPQGR